MTGFDLRRHVAKETAIGIVVNVVVSTVPGLMLLNSSAAATLRPVREVAVELTPQFFMAAFMSALVPSLLICWKEANGRLGIARAGPRLGPGRAAMIAAGLAFATTILVLALIHIVVAPLAAGGMGRGAILALRGGQGALAAALVTPIAIRLLFGRAWHARD